MTRDFRYYFEKDGMFLSKETKNNHNLVLTTDINKAQGGGKSKKDAEFHLLLHQSQGIFEGFEVTEHEFVDKDMEELIEGLDKINKKNEEFRRSLKHPKDVNLRCGK